ncbi:lipopolysaccharide biosynthesis [Pseudoalteromonas sp. SW0106-04]|uniref:Wzz/FepE/Etk N-terminal domain-containing protein n=1 Tax=Pseudoalteromonas sp. SW0106-04 TaxID=1702169 RepID=UPI0006B68B14|nr:Wzz/FepE/Etk N-terminal domain-containing protein [Pseudoalteromonas sp. SW0106-04]GAP74572.1 lipopolysaccharide biosynthesis [Pseudoalteromonas sp. SW0106-04]
MTSVNVEEKKIDNHLASFFIHAFFEHKWKITLSVLMFSIVGVLYSLSLPNQYQSTALMSPSESESSKGVAGMLGGLSSVASLAGVNLGGGEEEPFHVEERLKSRDFIIPFINRHQLKVKLFASEGWDREQDKIVYDDSIYDMEAGKWVRDVKPGQSKEPSDEEAYEKFRKYYSVTYDRKRNIFKVSFEFVSASFAKEVLDNLVYEFNSFSRDKKLEQINKNISFVRNYLDKAEYAEIRQALYSLLEEQLKTLMLTQSKVDYTLSLIQTPFQPEEKSGPSRALICILFFLLGGLLSYGYALAVSYRRL